MKNNKDFYKNWLKKAEDDFDFAECSFKETNFYSHVCWLAEQAIEKYLKAFIVKKKGFLEVKNKTHNLIYLSGVCGKYGLNLKKFEESLRWLSEIYIPARYPVHLAVDLNKEEAREALRRAEEIKEFIKSYLD